MPVEIAWAQFDYQDLLQETADVLGIPADTPGADFKYWSCFGDMGPGVGLHFRTAVLHRALDAADTMAAAHALDACFALAVEWDATSPSPTSWNQFSQIAGQALFINDEARAESVLAYASARAGDFDYPAARRHATAVQRSPALRDINPYNVEWLLHLFLRDQAAGRVKPDMSHGEGELTNIWNRLAYLAGAPRFHRLARAIECRVYPDETPYAMPDGIYQELGQGTGVFFPKAPRDFPRGV